MKFSVIVPAHDDQDSLNRTVGSLLAQTLKAHEIIVVDDGSDVPLTVPSGVSLIRLERERGERGSSAAKNAGADAATGDWLVFSDDDIIHYADALESVSAKIGLIDRNDVLINVFSVTPGKTIDRAAEKAVKDGRRVFSEQHMGIIRRDYFMRLGRYDDVTFLGWGYNNQDLSLRVVKSGGLVTSNVTRISNGELLHCVHTRPSIHDSVQAKSDFFGKYGKLFSSSMLVEEQREAS